MAPVVDEKALAALPSVSDWSTFRPVLGPAVECARRKIRPLRGLLSAHLEWLAESVSLRGPVEVGPLAFATGHWR